MIERPPFLLLLKHSHFSFRGCNCCLGEIAPQLHTHIFICIYMKMGRLFLVSLEGNIYSCKYCQAHLALVDDIISKSFHCRHGKAYLFDKVVNVTVGEKEERMMITGMHTVVDIFCVGCGSILGWKYEAAHEKSQKYKEGKFILERFKVLGPDGSHYSISQDARPVGSDADDA